MILINKERNCENWQENIDNVCSIPCLPIHLWDKHEPDFEQWWKLLFQLFWLTSDC